MLVAYATFFSHAAHADLPVVVDSVEEFTEMVDEEYYYRQRIDKEAALWAKDLMFKYIWTAKYPGKPGAQYNYSAEDIRRSMDSDISWMWIAGHGLIATFDYAHAEQTLAGSTSRFVLTLTKSKPFLMEVRNQCLELQALQGNNTKNVRECVIRLQNDLNFSQMIASNVSIIGTGGLISIGVRKIYARFARQWFARRVLPILPGFARTKLFAGVALGAAVAVPAGYVVASVEDNKESAKLFLTNLEAALLAVETEAERASVLRRKELEMESSVITLAKWIQERSTGVISKDTEASQRFIFDLKMFGPGYASLKTRTAELVAKRDLINQELGKIPNVTARLTEIAQKREQGDLTDKEQTLYRKAQYLSALRLVLTVISMT